MSRTLHWRYVWVALWVAASIVIGCGGDDDDNDGLPGDDDDTALDDDTDDDTTATTTTTTTTTVTTTSTEPGATTTTGASSTTTITTSTTTTTSVPTTTTLPTTTTTSTSSTTTTTTTVTTTTSTTTSTCLNDAYVEIEVDPLVAETGEDIRFKAEPGEFGQGVAWQLGDGDTSDEWNFLHAYDTPGEYAVSATVSGHENDPHTCEVEKSFMVRIETSDAAADDDDIGEIPHPDLIFVGGGGIVFGGIAADASDVKYIFFERAHRISYYSSTWETDWDEHFFATGTAPRVGVGDDGVIRVAYIDGWKRGWIYVADNAGGSFVHRVVDTGGSLADTDHFDMAVDADGHMHIVYIDSATQRLRHLTDESGAWQVETMSEPTADVGAFAIALDSNGAVHLACVIANVPTHVTNAGGSWTSEPVAAAATANRNPDIAVDEDGFVHISFSAYEFWGEIHYATNRHGNWQEHIVCEAEWGYDASCGRSSIIAVDNFHRVNILFNPWVTWTLEPPTHESSVTLISAPVGSTSFTTTDFENGSHNDMAYYQYAMGSSASRRLFFAYVRYFEFPAQVYYRRPGIDSREIAVASYNSAGDPCYARGADGSHHFSYKFSEFYHAARIGGVRRGQYLGRDVYYQWGLGRHSTGDTGVHHQIEVDASGVATIVYSGFYSESDMGNQYVHANVSKKTIDGDDVSTLTLLSDDYACQWCEGPPTSGYARDNNGTDHVGFMSYSYAGLEYLFDGAPAELIDGSGAYDMIAMATDDEGYAYAAYLQHTDRRLKLATNRSGSWESEVAATSLFDMFSRSNGLALDIDEAGHAHILFSDNYRDYAVIYVTDVSGTWAAEKIADNASAHRNGIVADASGAAHATYFDRTTQRIIYATNASGTWEHFAVGYGSGGAGISLDEAEGVVYVGYLAWDGLWVAAFTMP